MPTTERASTPTGDLFDRWSLRDGTRLALRTLRPQDAAGLGAMIGSLGTTSRRRRFHGAVNPHSASWLARLTQTDAAREWAVVVVRDGIDGEDAAPVLAEARLCCGRDGQQAEFALVVADAWQRSGIGPRTVMSLLAQARQRGLRRLPQRRLQEQGLVQEPELLPFARP